jgi:serine/threonine protein kinase
MIIICGIVLGMRYVHLEGYIHCDLKPESILIDGDGCPLITDFGSCRESEDGTFTPEGGTLRYAAPEMFQDDVRCTSNVDVSAFGSIVSEILTGRAVIAASLHPLPSFRRSNGDMPTIPESCGRRIQQLIRRCWSLPTEFRPSFHSISAEFGTAGFYILPGAAIGRVREFVESIRE